MRSLPGHQQKSGAVGRQFQDHTDRVGCEAAAAFPVGLDQYNQPVVSPLQPIPSDRQSLPQRTR